MFIILKVDTISDSSTFGFLSQPKSMLTLASNNIFDTVESAMEEIALKQKEIDEKAQKDVDDMIFGSTRFKAEKVVNVVKEDINIPLEVENFIIIPLAKVVSVKNSIEITKNFISKYDEMILGNNGN